MCAAELTWNTLKVNNWILMKHTWWNWHAVPGTAYWNMGHTAGTLRKIGIHFILRYNWHIDVPWNISNIFYWISFFLFNTWFGYWIVWNLYSILCKLYILWIGVLDWHIHCARVWYETIKNVEHSHDFHLGSASTSMKLKMYQVSFLTDTGFCSEILKYALFLFLALVDDKHQISLYLGLIKMANILQITFSNGFSFKKITVCLSVLLSVCLSVLLSVYLSARLSVCLSVCLSVPFTHFHYVAFMVSSWNFQEWLPMTEVMSMQTFKVRSQK